MGKEFAYNAGDTGDVGLIPGLGRSPGVGNGNSPVFLPGESHGQRRAWQAIAHEIAKLDTTEPLSMQIISFFFFF